MLQAFGIIGACLALLAYYMVTKQHWKPTDAIYHTVNLASCVVLGGVAIYTGTVGYLLLNGVWGFVAAQTLFKKFLCPGRLNAKTPLP